MAIFTPARMKDKVFQSFSSFIYDKVGIQMPPSKKTMLEARLQKRLKQLGIATFEEYGEFVFSREGQESELVHMIDVVTTNKTDFFREPGHFSFLTARALPAVEKIRPVTRSQPLRIWSAGCSSGEEAYSLAMVGLNELFRRQEPLRLTVYATDISADQLAKGKAGVYLEQSSSGTLPAYRSLLLKYATIEGGVVRMNPELRQHVKFGRFDLRRQPRLHTFDYIVCNHVFQYYDDLAQVNFVRNFCAVLNPGGLLFIEGLTARAQAQSGLQRLDGARNLYQPAPGKEEPAAP